MPRGGRDLCAWLSLKAIPRTTGFEITIGARHRLHSKSLTICPHPYWPYYNSTRFDIETFIFFVPPPSLGLPNLGVTRHHDD